MAFDFSVMRAHDKYVETYFRQAMQVSKGDDDFGIARVITTLRMILSEV